MELPEFKEKVLPSKNKLYRFAKRILENADEAEDTIQDIFLKLWDIRHQLHTYNSIEALAMRMVKNMCLNKLKAKRNHLFTLDNYSETPRFSSSVDSPEQKLEQKDTRNLIDEVINSLPEVQRMVVQMRDIEECDLEEIAEVLQKDVGYVRVNLSRARKKIRETLIELNRHGTANY